MSSGKTIHYPDNVKYSETHEWVRIVGNAAVVGITDYAQDQLGDVVFVELPAVGKNLKKGDSFGVVESVKAASDVYMPVGGTISAVNEALTDSPELVNQDPFGAGWMIKVFPYNAADLDQLLDAATYKSKLESGEIH